MRTTPRLRTASLCLAVFCATFAGTGSGLAAEPPAPPARPGFFARLGNVISRLTERRPPDGAVDNSARKNVQRSGPRPVMKSSPRSRADASNSDSGTPVSSQNREEKPSNNAGRHSDEASPQSGAAISPTDYPTGTLLREGLVKSPLPPYNVLDVSGLASGSLAKDPTTGRIFRMP